MNIFLRELRAHLRSFLVWSATMIFLIAAGMMKYGAFQKTGEAVNEIFASLPAGLQAVLGMAPGMDLTSVGVFYSIFYLYFLLLMSVHGTMLGASIIAKEERDKTADFLFVKPLRRRCAITAKIAAAMVQILLYNLVTGTASVLFTEPLNTTGTSLVGPIFRLMGILFAVQCLFLGIGLFLGASARSAERASGFGTAVILGAFVLKVLIDLNKDLDMLQFLTPFSYFDSYEILFEGTFAVPYLIVCLAVAGLGIAGTYGSYRQRDLRC